MQSQQAIETFNQRVREKVESGMSRRRAIVAVVKQDPDLHREYLISTNPQCPSARAQLS